MSSSSNSNSGISNSGVFDIGALESVESTGDAGMSGISNSSVSAADLLSSITGISKVALESPLVRTEGSTSPDSGVTRNTLPHRLHSPSRPTSAAGTSNEALQVGHWTRVCITSRFPNSAAGTRPVTQQVNRGPCQCKGVVRFPKTRSFRNLTREVDSGVLAVVHGRTRVSGPQLR